MDKASLELPASLALGKGSASESLSLSMMSSCDVADVKTSNTLWLGFVGWWGLKVYGVCNGKPDMQWELRCDTMTLAPSPPLPTLVAKPMSVPALRKWLDVL
eukprot:6489392-Amphidinium_carterae.3